MYYHKSIPLYTGKFVVKKPWYTISVCIALIAEDNLRPINTLVFYLKKSVVGPVFEKIERDDFDNIKANIGRLTWQKPSNS